MLPAVGTAVRPCQAPDVARLRDAKVRRIVGACCLALISVACSGTDGPPRTGATSGGQSGPADPAPTYSVVRASPAKYSGRTVTWVGAIVSSRITADGITNFWQVDSEGEESIFATSQDDQTSTAAAKARDKIRFDFTRQVTGIVSKELAPYSQGSSVLEVPLLTKVVVDAPPASAAH
jgi:hypothetical protein